MSARLWLSNNNEELMPLLMLARAKLKNWLGPSIACFRGTVASLAPVDLLWGFIHVLPDPKPEGAFSEKLSCTNDQRNYLHWKAFGDNPMLLRDLGLASETADQKDAGVAWMLPDTAPQERPKDMQLVYNRKYTAQD